MRLDELCVDTWQSHLPELNLPCELSQQEAERMEEPEHAPQLPASPNLKACSTQRLS